MPSSPSSTHSTRSTRVSAAERVSSRAPERRIPDRALLARLEDARARTDSLFRLVHPAALYDRPIPERHRFIFYVGHLEAFDWNLIGGHVLGRPALDSTLDRLFAFGIDPVDGDVPADEARDWPRPEQVAAYVRRARAALDQALAAPVDAAPGASPAPADPRSRLLADGTALHVAIEHRLMHAETLAYMLHQLPHERKSIAPELRRGSILPRARRGDMIEIPAGCATLGLSRSSGDFGWDNEYEEHAVPVPAFDIDATKVTNGDYREFVLAGGYREPALWSAADWDWIRGRGRGHPLLWSRRDGAWFYRAMAEDIPLPLDWPVFVSHAEAAAFARWAGKRLPTEAEWHRAAHGSPSGEERAYPWGDAPPGKRHGNFDFRMWDPAPVTAHPAGASAFGVLDLAGNGWEWTESMFAPFPGFTPFPFYPGYSADFFDGKHFVLKGAGPRTAACFLRRSFRNWFQPHYGYVHAGFRCVRDR